MRWSLYREDARVPAVAVALIAGGLSTVNPCGFALLPAFLTFYVGADERHLPAAPNRALQGLIVGVAVTAGFLTVFTIVGLPLALGARALTRSVPWLGMGIGVALIAVGVAMVAGRKPSVSMASPVKLNRNRRLKTVYLFGIGYGTASLGCTLPVFLAVVAASSASAGVTGSALVFAAYGAGMAMILMALAVSASLLRTGAAKRMKKFLPHMNRIAGALILITGAYLTYYWARVRFGPAATLADDPLVGLVERFSATIQRNAASSGGWFLLAAAAIVAAAILIVKNQDTA